MECYFITQIYEKNDFQVEGNNVFRVVEVRENMMFSEDQEKKLNYKWGQIVDIFKWQDRWMNFTCYAAGNHWRFSKRKEQNENFV